MDRFRWKFKELQAAAAKAKESFQAAEVAFDVAADSLNKAEDDFRKAEAAFNTFMVVEAKALLDKLDGEIFTARLDVTTQSGQVFPQIGFSQIWISPTADGFAITVDTFDSSDRYVTLGIYETPAQVQEVIDLLRAAIRRGDKAFTFRRGDSNESQRAV